MVGVEGVEDEEGCFLCGDGSTCLPQDQVELTSADNSHTEIASNLNKQKMT